MINTPAGKKTNESAEHPTAFYYQPDIGRLGLVKLGAKLINLGKRLQDLAEGGKA